MKITANEQTGIYTASHLGRSLAVATDLDTLLDLVGMEDDDRLIVPLEPTPEQEAHDLFLELELL